MIDTDRVLSLQDVRFGYPRGDVFLGPASFDIRPGSIWGVVGPNGAGKSTLLRLCAGLLAPTSGAIRWAGQPLADMPARQRAEHIAFLPQRTEASLWCTARQVTLLGRFPHQRHRYFESADDVRIADDALRTTETYDLADRPMDTLSGGEAQRVHLAAALAQQPDLLILDEPTASLDVFHLWRLARILRQLRDDTGPSIFLATHELNLALRLCDYLLLIHNGSIIHVGRPRDVLTPDALEAAYHVQFRVIESAGQSWIVPDSDFGLGDTDPAGAFAGPADMFGPRS